MPADDGNIPGGDDPGRTDPGADTAMFRAYVEQDEPSATAARRPLAIGLVVAAVVLALVVLVLVAS